MSDRVITPGTKVKEVATASIVYQNCTVLQSDAVGVLLEVDRTIAESGNVETVVSKLFIPWGAVLHVIVSEERT
jgi:hypothetical protein